jgi:hypothetical protein
MEGIKRQTRLFEDLSSIGVSRGNCFEGLHKAPSSDKRQVMWRQKCGSYYSWRWLYLPHLS